MVESLWVQEGALVRNSWSCCGLQNLQGTLVVYLTVIIKVVKKTSLPVRFENRVKSSGSGFTLPCTHHSPLYVTKRSTIQLSLYDTPFPKVHPHLCANGQEMFRNWALPFCNSTVDRDRWVLTKSSLGRRVIVDKLICYNGQTRWRPTLVQTEETHGVSGSILHLKTANGQLIGDRALCV